jgi:putative hydrolase of HD superfamily
MYNAAVNAPISRELLTRIYDAAYMQRWNDQIRPVDLTELDKQAHKMIIAYMLGKFEEDNADFRWTDIIEGGFFEFLQRLVVTDLKPQVFYKIKEDRAKYRRLNEWVYTQLKDIIAPLGSEFCSRFSEHFENDTDSVNRRILSAAHLYATKWEFDIIERANPQGYEIAKIGTTLQAEQGKYGDVKGIMELALRSNLRSFVDLCGLLRFQLRWSHVHRVPKTSVLGHMLIVAMLSYLLSLRLVACERRCVNNYFTGLFHDLPEVLTRDIISPVKHSIRGLSNLIKRYEKEQMEEKVYPLVPEDWYPEMRMFTENEFKSIVTIDGQTRRTTSDDINRKFNKDDFNPRDGELVKAVDDLSAFLEAYLAKKNGIVCKELRQAEQDIRKRYERKAVAGIDFGELYMRF